MDRMYTIVLKPALKWETSELKNDVERLKGEIQSSLKGLEKNGLAIDIGLEKSGKDISAIVKSIEQSVGKMGAAFDKFDASDMAKDIKEITGSLKEMAQMLDVLQKKDFTVSNVFSLGKASTQTSRRELELNKNYARALVEYTNDLKDALAELSDGGGGKLRNALSMSGVDREAFLATIGDVEDGAKTLTKIDAETSLKPIRTIIVNLERIATQYEQVIRNGFGAQIERSDVDAAKAAIDDQTKSLTKFDDAIDKIAKAQAGIGNNGLAEKIGGNFEPIKEQAAEISKLFDDLRTKIEQTFDLEGIDMHVSGIKDQLTSVGNHIENLPKIGVSVDNTSTQNQNAGTQTVQASAVKSVKDVVDSLNASLKETEKTTSSVESSAVKAAETSSSSIKEVEAAASELHKEVAETKAATSEPYNPTVYDEWKAKVAGITLEMLNAQRAELSGKEGLMGVERRKQAYEELERVIANVEATLSMAAKSGVNAGNNEDVRILEERLSTMKSLQSQIDNGYFVNSEFTMSFKTMSDEISACTKKISNVSRELTAEKQNTDSLTKANNELEISYERIKQAQIKLDSLYRKDGAVEADKEAIESLREHLSVLATSNPSVDGMTAYRQELKFVEAEITTLSSKILDASSVYKENETQTKKNETATHNLSVAQEKLIGKQIQIRDAIAGANRIGIDSEEVRNLESYSREIDALRSGLDSGKTTLDEYNSKIDILDQKISNSINQLRLETKEFQNSAESASKLSTMLHKIAEAKDSATSAISDAENKGMSDHVQNNAVANLRKYISALEELERSAKEPGASLKYLNGEVNRVSSSIKESTVAVKKYLETNKPYIADTEKYAKASQQLSRAIGTAERMLRNFTAAKNGDSAKSYKAIEDAVSKYKELQSQFEAQKISAREYDKQLAMLRSTVISASTEIARAGENTKAFGGRIQDVIGKFSMYFSASRVFMTAIRYMRQMVSTAIELDSAMTDLRIVTGDSTATLESWADTAIKKAKELGVSVTDLINATTTFARLGNSLEDATLMATLTGQLQRVGDIQEEDATNAITAIVKAWDISVDELELIMDKLVITGNNFPISVSQLAEGMNNASSALAAAGNGFDESVALLTAANTTIQDASKSSTGLRTIAARLRNTKTELENLGEDWEPTVKYENLVSTLSDLNVSLVDANGEFRSTYDIMKDISLMWNDLTSSEQAALANSIAGVRQQSVFYAIIDNFNGVAQKSFDTMQESAGSLDTAYSVYTESIAAHINMLKVAFAELSKTIVDSSLAKGVVDLGTGGLQALTIITKVVNALGGLKTILTALTGIVVSKKLSSSNPLSFIDKIANSVKIMHDSNPVLREFEEGFKVCQAAGVSFGKSVEYGMLAATQAINTTKLAINGLVAAITIATIAVQIHNQKVRENNERIAEAGEKATKSTDDITSSLTKYMEASQSAAHYTEDISDKQRDLANTLGIVKDSYDDATSSAKDFTKASIEAARQKLGENLADQYGDYLLKRSNVEKLFGKSINLFGSQNDGMFYSKDTNMLSSLQTALINGGISGVGINGTSLSFSKIVSNYANDTKTSLEDAKEYRDLLVSVRDILFNDVEGGRDSDLFKKIGDEINRISPALDELVDTLGNFNSGIIRDAELSTYQLPGFDGKIPKTREEFEKYRQAVIDTVIVGGQFIGSEEDIASAVDGVLAKESPFVSFYADVASGATSAANANQKLLNSVNSLSSKDMAEALKDVNDLEQKFAKLAEADYVVDVDQIKQLIDLFGDNYLDYLIIEGEQVKLNTGAWNEYIFEKKKDLTDIDSIRASIDALKSERDALESYKDSIRNNNVYAYLVDEYQSAIDRVRELGVDAKQTVFGNIDTNNRQVIEWTGELIDQYKGELVSLGISLDSLEGSISTILGASKTFSIDSGSGSIDIEVAFSPILQTENGPVILGDRTVNDYLYDILKSASDSGGITLENVLKLDAEGIEKDGILIKNIIADVGDTARATGEAMHYTGKYGELSSIGQEIQDYVNSVENGRDAVAAYADESSRCDKKIDELNDQIEEQTKLLSIQESLLYGTTSVIADYAYDISGFNSYVTDMVSSLETVADIQAEVANGFIISTEKALEFAKTYPEILSGATLAGEGQIQLNKDVVDAFVSGKETELRASVESQIKQLEADRSNLQSKKELYQAELKMLTNALKYGTNAELEAAIYRVDVANQTAKAVIANGGAESDAYAFAMKNMVENTSKYDGVVADVATNIAKNFAESSYESAVGVQENTGVMNEAIATVAAQAHQSAIAVSGIASGTVLGSDRTIESATKAAKLKYTTQGPTRISEMPDLLLGDSTSSKQKNIRDLVIASANDAVKKATTAFKSITLGGTEFNGTSYSYDGVTTTLDKFMLSLENGIVSADSAISKIDGQISLLKNLSLTDLSSFRTNGKNTNSSAGSAGSSSNKDSDFAKMYAYHQHLLKMEQEEYGDYFAWLDKAYKEAFQKGEITLDEYYKYEEEIHNGVIELVEDANDAFEKLVQYRVKMLESEKNKEKETLNARLKLLKDFYDSQVDLLKKEKEEEKYLEEQDEKRKAVTDIQTQIEQLRYDDSAWAQKKKIELADELAKAQKELDDFEEDNAYNLALDALEASYNKEAENLQKEIDAIDEILNDPNALYNKALNDVKNNTKDLYDEMVKFAKDNGEQESTVKTLWENAYIATSDLSAARRSDVTGVEKAVNNVATDVGRVIAEQTAGNKTTTAVTNATGYSTSPVTTTAPPTTGGATASSSAASTPAPASTSSNTSSGTGSASRLKVGTAVKVNGSLYSTIKGTGGTADVNGRTMYISAIWDNAANPYWQGEYIYGLSYTPGGSNSGWVKLSQLSGYAYGTRNATAGLHRVDELGAEAVFSSADGNRYRMLSSGDKVFDADSTNFLYNFAQSGKNILNNLLHGMTDGGLLSSIGSNIVNNITMSPITINGAADALTVSEMRRAQRDALSDTLRAFSKLQR